MVAIRGGHAHVGFPSHLSRYCPVWEDTASYVSEYGSYQTAVYQLSNNANTSSVFFVFSLSLLDNEKKVVKTESKESLAHGNFIIILL